MVPRAMRGTSTYVRVVISPATMQVPVVTRTSHATRPVGSSARTASRTASEIWSAILSGWPSVTDSDVKRKVRSAIGLTERTLALAVGDPAGEVRGVVRVDRVRVPLVACEHHRHLIEPGRAEGGGLDGAHAERELLQERLHRRAELPRDAPVAVAGVAPVVGVEPAHPVDQTVARRRPRGRD